MPQKNYTTKVLLLFLSILSSISVSTEAIASGIETIYQLGGFSADNPNKWTLTQGENLKFDAEFGKIAENGDENAVKLTIEKKDPTDVAGERNWFAFGREVALDSSVDDADGLLISLAVDEDSKRYFSISLETKNSVKYECVLHPSRFSTSTQDRLLKTGDFKATSSTKDAPSLKLSDITSVKLVGCEMGFISLNKIALYKHVEATAGWLKFGINANNRCKLFEPGEQIKLELTVTGTPPSGTSKVICEVKDFFGQTVKRGVVSKPKVGSKYIFKMPKLLPGYYEVRAFSLDSDGKQELQSCISTTGSSPAGLETFAVMPATINENIVNMLNVGEKSFFGMWAGRSIYKLREYMGLTWGPKQRSWKYIEPEKPTRLADEMASWATEKVTFNNTLPPYLSNLCSFNSHHYSRLPEWAKGDEEVVPGFKSWDDYLLLVRDKVRSHKLMCPFMSQRIYEPVWEIDLQTPDMKYLKPYFEADDVVEMFKRIVPVIKGEDPGAFIMGPTAMLSPGNLDWYESLFKAGLLDYVDAIATHYYQHPLPENNKIPETLGKLRALIKKYNNGNVLPIFNSESGFKSVVGSENKIREQAQWISRYTMILKGEGIKAHIAFYYCDYDGGSWGLFFNNDPKLAYDPKSISPKASTPALAVCANQLIGSKPVSNLRNWGVDVWGYIFEKNDEPIIAIWHPNKKQKFSVPVGDVTQVKVVDIMGGTDIIKISNGALLLEIGPNPLYIHGSSKDIYLSEPPPLAGSPANSIPVRKVYPGESIKLPVSAKDFKKIKNIQVWNGIQAVVAEDNSKVINISVPYSAKVMPVPVVVKYVNSDGRVNSFVQWLKVGSSVDIKRCETVIDNDTLGVNVFMQNFIQRPASVSLSYKIEDRSSNWKTEQIEIAPESDKSLFIPLQDMQNGIKNPHIPFVVKTKLSVDNQQDVEHTEKIYCLSAYQNDNANRAGMFPDQVSISGAGSSGKIDLADIQFSWDKSNLYLNIKCTDDVFHQTTKNGSMAWMQDSLQIAFDSDPESKYLYDPAAGLFSKKVTDVSIARLPKGNRVWRHTSHNEQELPLGDITDTGFVVDIVRDDAKGITTYKCAIPWKEIGIKTVKQNQQIGISILVNDSDGEETPRKWIELFGGIVSGRNYALFGRLTLR